jgi:3-dehydroquinate dehydratase-2
MVEEINARLETLARELGTELVIVQSNHEGILIDTLHANMDKADGAIINPGGITHYGVPLHDAIAAMPFPVIEVHLSNLAAREVWRSHSMISPVADGTIQGLGWRSYTTALRAVVEIARDPKKR